MGVCLMSTSKDIDAIVFDIGNVLLRWAPHNLYRRMGLTEAETLAFMTDTELADINHRQLDAGAPFAKTLADLAARFPEQADFIEAFDRRWPEMLAGAIDANVAIMRSLLAAGIPVHGISNFSRTKFDIARTSFPFLDEFDELVISGDVGIVKPDVHIFELLVARCDLVPARTIFIDDSADNIETAHRMGFFTIHYEEHRTDLAAELRQFGLRWD